MGIIYYAASWAINFAVIAVVAAAADEVSSNSIERSQWLGFFILFGMPTLVEALSYLIQGKPFFF